MTCWTIDRVIQIVLCKYQKSNPNPNRKKIRLDVHSGCHHVRTDSSQGIARFNVADVECKQIQLGCSFVKITIRILILASSCWLSQSINLAILQISTSLYTISTQNHYQENRNVLKIHQSDNVPLEMLLWMNDMCDVCVRWCVWLCDNVHETIYILLTRNRTIYLSKFLCRQRCWLLLLAVVLCWKLKVMGRLLLVFWKGEIECNWRTY